MLQRALLVKVGTGTTALTLPAPLFSVSLIGCVMMKSCGASMSSQRLSSTSTPQYTHPFSGGVGAGGAGGVGGGLEGAGAAWLIHVGTSGPGDLHCPVQQRSLADVNEYCHTKQSALVQHCCLHDAALPLPAGVAVRPEQVADDVALNAGHSFRHGGGGGGGGLAGGTVRKRQA